MSSESVPATTLKRENFRTDEDWGEVQRVAVRQDGLEAPPESIEIGNRYVFEDIKTIPQDWRRDLLNLVIGSHDPNLQEKVNRFRPVQVFNLSITPPHVIEDTHERMSRDYHKDGGDWSRRMMPRTIMVFLNDEDGLTREQQDEAAMELSLIHI